MPSIEPPVKLRNSFQARVACVLIVLSLVVIGALYFSVKAATRSAVHGQALAQLEVGTRVFERLLDTRGRRLADGVQLLAADFGFRDAVPVAIRQPCARCCSTTASASTPAT